MIQFTVNEADPGMLNPVYERLLRDSNGRVVPMALAGYERAAIEAGVNPQTVPDDVTYDAANRCYVFTFKDAETYPSLYSRSQARLLAIGLNPSENLRLRSINDLDVAFRDFDSRRAAEQIGISIRKARQARG